MASNSSTIAGSDRDGVQPIAARNLASDGTRRGALDVAADVDDAARGRRGRRQIEQRARHLRDVREAARLPAVAVHGERQAGDRLLHEARQNHAVITGLARTDGVEQARDDHGGATARCMAERQPFGEGLGAGVAAARPGRYAGLDRFVLVERHAAAAIDLAARREQHADAGGGGRGEHVLGAALVGLHHAERVVGEPAHADDASEMQHRVGCAADGGGDARICDRCERHGEAWMRRHRREVGHAATRQVVDGVHAVAAAQQFLDDMRADEASPAGDGDAHAWRQHGGGRLGSAGTYRHRHQHRGRGRRTPTSARPSDVADGAAIPGAERAAVRPTGDGVRRVRRAGQ
jgi:hypothetical protein